MLAKLWNLAVCSEFVPFFFFFVSHFKQTRSHKKICFYFESSLIWEILFKSYLKERTKIWKCNCTQSKKFILILSINSNSYTWLLKVIMDIPIRKFLITILFLYQNKEKGFKLKSHNQFIEFCFCGNKKGIKPSGRQCNKTLL